MPTGEKGLFNKLSIRVMIASTELSIILEIYNQVPLHAKCSLNFKCQSFTPSLITCQYLAIREGYTQPQRFKVFPAIILVISAILVFPAIIVNIESATLYVCFREFCSKHRLCNAVFSPFETQPSRYPLPNLKYPLPEFQNSRGSIERNLSSHYLPVGPKTMPARL